MKTTIRLISVLLIFFLSTLAFAVGTNTLNATSGNLTLDSSDTQVISAKAFIAPTIDTGQGASEVYPKGTLTNGYLCSYTSSGTLISCNTNPASFEAAGVAYSKAESISRFVNRSSWVTIDNYPAACAGSLYTQGIGDTLTCTDVNTTIDDRIKSINYNITQIATIGGTPSAGSALVNVQILGDGLSYNVTEQVADPSVEVMMNATGVTSFDQIVMRIWYSGGGGHIMYLYLWDYGTSTWEQYYSTVGSTGWENVVLSVPDGSSHISGGLVRLNWTHSTAGAGSTGHVFRIDYTSLVKGFSGSTISSHDALQDRDDLSKNHPWAVRMNTNITANQNNIAALNATLLANYGIYLNYTSTCSAGQIYEWGTGCITTPTGTTYSAGGTLLDLTGTTFSVNEGTLTDTKYCTYEDGTGIVCNSEGGVPTPMSFSDSAWINLNGYINSNSSVNSGNVNISGAFNIGSGQLMILGNESHIRMSDGSALKLGGDGSPYFSISDDDTDTSLSLSAGALNLMPGGDVDDYLNIATVGNAVAINRIGGSLGITTDAGGITLTDGADGTTIQSSQTGNSININECRGIWARNATCITVPDPVGNLNRHDMQFGLGAGDSFNVVHNSGTPSTMSIGIMPDSADNSIRGSISVSAVTADTNIYAKGTGADLILNADNEIILKPSGDTDDYLSLSTVSNVPRITVTGGQQVKFMDNVNPMYEGRYGSSSLYNYINLADGYGGYGGMYLYNSTPSSTGALQFYNAGGIIEMMPNGETNEGVSFEMISGEAYIRSIGDVDLLFKGNGADSYFKVYNDANTMVSLVKFNTTNPVYGASSAIWDNADELLFLVSGDLDDYLSLSTSGNEVLMKAVSAGTSTFNIQSDGDINFLAEGGEVRIADDGSHMKLYISSGSSSTDPGILFRASTVTKTQLWFDSSDADNRLFLVNGTDQTHMYIQMHTGKPFFPGVHAFTTASAANVYVSSTGQLIESTSSARYKTNIEPYYEASWIYNLEPVIYDSLDGEQKQRYGFIAEQVAEVNPQVVDYTVLDDNTTVPQSVEYSRLVSPMLAEMKRMREMICKHNDFKDDSFCTDVVDSVDYVEQPKYRSIKEDLQKEKNRLVEVKKEKEKKEKEDKIITTTTITLPEVEQ